MRIIGLIHILLFLVCGTVATWYTSSFKEARTYAVGSFVVLAIIISTDAIISEVRKNKNEQT